MVVEVVAAVVLGLVTALLWLLHRQLLGSASVPFASPPGKSAATNDHAHINGAGGAGGAVSASAASSSPSPSSSLLPMSIFFGSQSGTAESFARELSEEAKVFGFHATAKDLEDYDAEEELRKESYAVFLMATFGEGEPTDNAAAFYEWLCSDARVADDAAGVRYSVFALGNRQYEHFCLIGRKVDERMTHIGGVRVAELGEGDDDGSLEGDFRAWKAAFWERTNAAFGTSAAAEAAGADTAAYASAFVLTPLPQAQQAQQAAVYTGGLHNLVTDPKHRVVLAKVVDNRELRQSTEDDGSTRHIELDLSSVSLPYMTADNCGVYPRNDHRTVAQLIRRLGLDASQLLLMKGNGTKRSFLPSPCSVQDIFLHYLDIGFTPRVSQLSTFAQYAREEKDRATLLYWSKAGAEEYLADQKSFVELLMELPSLSPPLHDIVDWTPRIAPRFYTISSSSLVQPKRLSLTVSVLTHHKPRGRKAKGLCSAYLAQLRLDKDSAAIFIRPSAFRLPRSRSLVSHSTLPSPSPSPSPPFLPPVLMIGPGTGLAPFRGFIQEATAHRAKAKAAAQHAPSATPPTATATTSTASPPPPSVGYGELVLFFGCRSSVKDFIYREELLRAVDDGVLAQLHLAFSREQAQGSDSRASEDSVGASSTAAATASLASSSLEPSASRHFTNGVTARVYVQDRMRGVGASVWEAIHSRKGYVYVCGGTAMGRSVREVLIECCKEKGQMTDKQADLYIKKMQEQKRYVQELWS